MKLFTPHLQKSHNHVISQHRFSVPQSHMDNGQVRYEMKHMQGTRNMTQNTYIPEVETEAVGEKQQPKTISTCKPPL